MSTGINMDDFRLFLEGLKAIPKEKVEDLLHHFPEVLCSDLLKCQFYLIRCTADEIREDDFIGFLLNSIVKFVLKHDEYSPDGHLDSYVLDNIQDIWTKARDQFLTKNKNAAEVGELILFVLLESQGIIQLLNKMNLKTNSEMPVHGLDAIHIQVTEKNIIIHQGQSKMYKNLNGAIDAALQDVKNFSNNKKRQELELRLVSNYMDTKKFDDYANVIKDILNPYSRHKEQRQDMNSIFIGFDWKVLSEISDLGGTDLTSSLKEKYFKIHDDISKSIHSKVMTIGDIKKKRFSIYLLPFSNTGKFRNKFVQRLQR